MINFKNLFAAAVSVSVLGGGLFGSAAIAADWKPNRPVEFIVTAGPGGGTDQFARVVQSIIQKYNLMPVPVIVANKGGGAGTEGLVHIKSAKGDANKLVFTTNLAYLMPMITKVGYGMSDFTPVAIMAADEFILWTYADAPYKNAKDLIADAKNRNGSFKMGGAQSKDTDHILTRQIEKATATKMTYIPFKSGGEVAAQLSGKHVEANTNNPSENVSHWKAGKVRPLCVFSKQQLSIKDKVTETQGFGDIPTCISSGIAIEEFNMPRMVLMASGTKPEQLKYYENILAQVRQKPEWIDWLKRGSQSSLFVTGKELTDFVQKDAQKHKAIFAEEGWLVN